MEQTSARYSIGIDLGTTNSALAFVPLAGAAPSEVLAIPQLASAIAIEAAPSLPSFLFLPQDAAAEPATSVQHALDDRWVIGRFARDKAADAPGRVVHSAKSWLSQHSADRSAPFLPWGSDDVDRSDKLSPMDASALMLRHLREAWNERFAPADDDDATFDRQVITITVPASFDAVAQQLTFDAARMAGYPDTVRLLEEPQAALYRWLELHEPADTDWGVRPDTDPGKRCILVVDIGGGTSDFSLFAFDTVGGRGDGRLQRLAVSEHILLGGDNMDLALAHRLEAALADGETLSSRQWGFVVARCRDIKEEALGTPGTPDEAFSVAVAGRGSSFIATTHSAQLSRATIEQVLLDGFFAPCTADEYPLRATAGLREFGLPFARDPAITRHLADFLRDRPAVDAVLFNGGALSPQRIRQRLRELIGAWQNRPAPLELDNREPELAVARGAACFGRLVVARAERIAAGAAHAIYLEVHATDAADVDRQMSPALVCVLPHGAPTEQTFTIDTPALEVRINRLVRFATYSSARRTTDRAGDIVLWNERDFQALPLLETSITPPNLDASSTGGAGQSESADATLAIRLTARSSELGRLEIACVSTDPRVSARWPLHFHLDAARDARQDRNQPDGSGAAVQGANVAAAALGVARARITTQFGAPLNGRDKLTATRLTKSLETILQLPKNAWNIVLVRSLWATLESSMRERERSAEHEEAWLILSGFLLRPGFGAALDDVRIDRLWLLHESGLHHAVNSVAIAQYVLWRRVCGGLSAERQALVISAELKRLRDGRAAAPELVLLGGSLERLSVALKIELVELYTEAATMLYRERRHHAHYLIALGALLNRAPLYGGPETVVPADAVARTFDRFADFDWEGPRRLELQTLFLRAARIVDDRAIDVPRSLRNRLADKLEKTGVPAAKIAALKHYQPLPRAERAGSSGESLPPGLILREPGARR